MTGGGADGGVLKGDVAIEGGLLRSPDAELMPAGDGHGFDEGEFGFRGGLEFGCEGGEEGLEAVLGFAFEDDGAGEKSVTGGVARGVEFALKGEGASGTGSVAAGGFDLFLGSHDFVLAD